ncbi:MAG: caspase family protein, partial [Bacteroides sp.]|nr:caspase family protein [Bacteroides sp.]
NGRDAVLSSNGDFNRDVMLKVGDNKITVQATDLELNFSTCIFHVYRADASVSLFAQPSITGADDKYYALIIGISDYPDPMIPNLDNHPTRDANALSELLVERYRFAEENMLLLLNPDRVEILKSFDRLSRSITENDNLLIFFAGHGYYDQEANLGYWLPSDAESDFTANWIYNDVLVANLKRIHSKHTLLITDACFSGSIFKTRSLNFGPVAYKKKYELRSRKAITSGVLEAVPNESVFFKYLLDRLDSNAEKYMSASELFTALEFPVSNNSPNSPQYGTIQNVNDEGGDFIFIKK